MALIVGAVLAVFQQFVRINTVIYYAPTIFEQVVVARASSAILATSVVGVVNVLATIVAILLVDRLGRRRLLLGGSSIMGVSTVAQITWTQRSRRPESVPHSRRSCRIPARY